MSNIILRSVCDPTQFRWRDKQGRYHYPPDMETRHLFFTIRMIWNHTMPEDAKLYPFRCYGSFGPVYTAEYMADAVRHMLRELNNRDDLEKQWRLDLAWMVQYLFAQTGEEVICLNPPSFLLEKTL